MHLGKNCLYRHADGEEKPSKRSKTEKTQGAVAILKGKSGPGLFSKFRSKAGQARLNASAGHAKKSQDAPGTKFKFGKQKGHLEALSKNANLMSEILARRSLRKEHLEKPQDKKSTPAQQHGIWRENM